MFHIGFPKAEIGIFDNTFTTTEVHVIEGVNNKGATRTFTVEGLSADAVKVFGSNKAYYISRKGIGDLQATLAALDIPFEVQQDILGWNEHTDGFLVGGADTEPPYTSAIFYSENGAGEPVAFSLFRGTFAIENLSGETKEDTPVEPGEESYTMSCTLNDDNNGYGIAVGADKVAKLRTYTFPGLPPSV